MINTQSTKPVYDLEERTFQFAKNVRLLIKSLPKTISILEDAKQVVRPSGSVGANYREANEAISKKDFVLHIKISRKEAKESAYWLRLILETNDPNSPGNLPRLIQEANELTKIFASIAEKSK